MPDPVRPHCFRGLLLALGAVVVSASCGGGSGGGSEGVVGQELSKPGGGTYFLDAHHGGGASRLHLREIFWGRLVDVHQLDQLGEPDPEPVFRDYLIRETVQSDGTRYRLETNAISQRTRLVILSRRGAPPAGQETFEQLLAEAESGLAPILPRDDDGSSAGPFSLLARNGCLALYFDDLLEDGFEARAALPATVRIVTGYPPSSPFEARRLFDPNHGGVAGSSFHSTRLLIDLSVSTAEAGEAEFPLQVNALGLPASIPGDARPNVSLRFPTRLDPDSGQFQLLTNLAGAGLDPGANAPADLAGPTRDVVRALRSGRGDDGNNGFLLDLNRPEIIGAWPALIAAASFEPGDTSGLALRLDLEFATTCLSALEVGDIVQAGSYFLAVVQPTGEPVGSSLRDVHVRIEAGGIPASPDALRGGSLVLSTFSPTLPLDQGCWVSIAPPPRTPPTGLISPASQFRVRFSEPMNPAALDPFETFRLARGDTTTPLLPSSLVIASVVGAADLREFTLSPLLPLAYEATGDYTLRLADGVAGIVDLAGNPLVAVPRAIEFKLDPLAPVAVNGGIALRFSSPDELEPIGFDDLRGQFFYELESGSIRGRPVSYDGNPVDRTMTIPGVMIPFGPGVQTPLSPMGSMLQYVWRYCDLGWQVEDETKHNLDVMGIAWAPVGGNVVSDFFDRFEIRLAHSRRQPDETRVATGANWPCSGLGAGAHICPPCPTNVPFSDNILVDPRSPQAVVHDRSLGYRIRPSDVFTSPSGTRFQPYPMNRAGGPLRTFTWRDTAVLAMDGADSPGIPLEIETGAPLFLEPGPPGRIAAPRRVPSFGLPLLIEIRAFPSSSGVGMNPLDISLAMNAQQLPSFRAYTTGGINVAGQPVLVNPDLAFIPQGGFNPASSPPGRSTPFEADNSFYMGQLDTVVRVSRAHTIWFTTMFADPEFFPPIVSPPPEEQPGAARVVLEFRGAEGFEGAAATRAFDAGTLDPYGNPEYAGSEVGRVRFWRDDPRWTESIADLNGASFLQLRMSFFNDLAAGATPTLSAVGVAFAER